MNMGNRNFLLIGAAFLVIVAAGLVLFLSQNKASVNSSPSPSPSASSEESMMKDETASPSGDSMMEEDSMMDEEQTVTLGENGFSPKTLTIKKGEKIVWKNESGEMGNVSSNNHPTHTLYSPLNLGNFADGETVSLRFNEAGTFGYHDHLNPQFTGTIVVQ